MELHAEEAKHQPPHEERKEQQQPQQRQQPQQLAPKKNAWKSIPPSDRKTPLQYLSLMIDEARDLDSTLITNEWLEKNESFSVQQRIELVKNILKPKKQDMPRQWVLVKPISAGSTELERYDYKVYLDLPSAQEACIQANILARHTRKQSHMGKKIVLCRVEDLRTTQALPLRQEPRARCCTELMCFAIGKKWPYDADRSGEDAPLSSLLQEMRDTLGTNGYLSLKALPLRAEDVPALMQLCGLFNNADDVSVSGSDSVDSSVDMNICVRQLGLSCNRFLGEGIEILTTSIRATPCCHCVIALFLSSNQMGDDGATAVADLMRDGCLPHLYKIGLNDNEITDVGSGMLTAALTAKTCSPVEVVGLSNNRITAKGALEWAAAMSSYPALKRLFLNNNADVHDEGALALATAAQVHPSLKRLGLACCGLSERATGLAILKAIQMNGCEPKGEILLQGCTASVGPIERICVCGNDFGAEAEEVMRQEPRINFLTV